MFDFNIDIDIIILFLLLLLHGIIGSKAAQMTVVANKPKSDTVVNKNTILSAPTSLENSYFHSITLITKKYKAYV